MNSFRSSIFPLITTCPLVLSLAKKQLNLFLLFSIIFSISFISSPKTATIPPSFLGTAFCIALPLIFKSFIVSLKFITLEQAKAEYSPKECPAKKLALLMSNEVSFLIASKIA